MKKINYFQIGSDLLAKIQTSGVKPTLLLHVCCAPCTTYPFELLSQYFQITIMYNNSNIYPEEEYQRRLNELKQYLNVVDPTIQLIIPAYNNEEFTDIISIRKDDKEGYARCRLCFFLRMDEAFAYAHEHNYQYFTTALSISRQKNEQAINRIGLVLQDKYPNTRFLPHDFKKKKGIDRAIILSKEHQLYQQDYCGCVYSIKKS